MADDVGVLLVSGEYPPAVGGLADYTACLRGALEARGLDVRIMTRRRRGPALPGVFAGVGRWDARALPWLVRLAPRDGIVHVQYQAAAFDLLGDICLAPTVLRLARPDTRVVTTFHDARVPYLFPRAGPLRRLAIDLLARTSAAVLASDERDLRALGGPSPRHHLVPIGSNVDCEPPPGYDRHVFRGSLGLAPDQLAIAYFGLLNASKGLDVLLATFQLVLDREPRARLLLVGGEVGASDPTDRLTAARFQSRVEPFGDRVLRPGYLAPERLSSYLLAADVALMPYADGASARRGTLLACATHGLPIVTTGPNLAEYVLVAPVGDAPALAEAVLQVATEPTLRERLQRASRHLAKQSSWPGIAERHLAIYHALAHGG